MPDRYGFNLLGNDVYCIEEDCVAGGPIYEWKEDRRKGHFLTHGFHFVEGSSPRIEGIVRKDNCRICGGEFEQERKRGRPRVLCYVCKPIGGEYS